MKTYPKMKDSGVKWIGEIPEHWITSRVKHLVDKTKYYQIGDGDHGSIKPEMYVEEGIPYIRVQNLSWNGKINAKGLVYIPEQIHKSNLKSQIIEGDLLIAKTGATIGKLGLVDKSIGISNTTSSVGKITIDNSKYSNLFYLFYFQSLPFQEQIWVSGIQKSAQPGFNIDDLVDFDTLVPTLSEQKQIVEFLNRETSRIELEIERNQKLIKLVQEKRQILINDVVTKGIKPSVSMKDSGVKWIGEIPEHWEIGILKNYSTHVTKGATPTTYGFDWSDNEDDILFIRNECIKENQFNLEGSLRISKKAHEFMKRSKVYPNDILISITGEIGKACIFPEGLGESNINQHIARVSTISKKIFPKYLVNLLNSNKFRTYFEIINQGLTHAHLNLEQVRNTRIIIPPLNEQEKIGKFLDIKNTQIDSFITKTKLQIKNLKEYNQSLISSAVTGKIDVRETVT
jgi:type I restriction enzyme, S subunit